jgi:hypothetical protein
MLPDHLRTEVGAAHSIILSFSRALVLYYNQIVKLKSVYLPQRSELPELIDPIPFVQPQWTSRLYTVYRDQLQLSIQELNQFKEFFWGYVSLEKPGFLWRAISQFGSASDMAGDWGDADYRLTDYVRSLEALLGEGQDVAHKLALRTSALVGGSAEDKLNTYDFMKAAYNCRSRSVHGEGLPNLRFRRWKGSLRGLGMVEQMDILHWYCRMSLVHTINLISAIYKDENLAAKWKNLSESNKKLWVTELLDYSLLRNDLADSLQSFYDRSVSIDVLWSKYSDIRESAFLHPLMF